MDENERRRILKHGTAFADFWLGMAGAGTRGVSELLGKPEPTNGEKKNKTFTEAFESVVDRAARGATVALEQAKRTAELTQQELYELHRKADPERKAPDGTEVTASDRAKELYNETGTEQRAATSSIPASSERARQMETAIADLFRQLCPHASVGDKEMFFDAVRRVLAGPSHRHSTHPPSGASR